MSGYCQRVVVFNKGEDLCADPEQDGELNPGIHWAFVYIYCIGIHLGI